MYLLLTTYPQLKHLVNITSEYEVIRDDEESLPQDVLDILVNALAMQSSSTYTSPSQTHTLTDSMNGMLGNNCFANYQEASAFDTCPNDTPTTASQSEMDYFRNNVECKLLYL